MSLEGRTFTMRELITIEDIVSARLRSHGMKRPFTGAYFHVRTGASTSFSCEVDSVSRLMIIFGGEWLDSLADLEQHIQDDDDARSTHILVRPNATRKLVLEERLLMRYHNVWWMTEEMLVPTLTRSLTRMP